MKAIKSQTSYGIILDVLKKQVKTKKNKEDWGELKITTEYSKDESRKFIWVENKEVGFSFNRRGDFLGVCNWKD